MSLLISLVGAGIVHIAVLLLLPQFSERDAWSSLAEAADYYKAVRIDAGDGSPPIVKAVDPLFHAAGCRFDLDEGPVHIRAPGNVPFWSVSIYNRAGQNVYSFNDRATDNGALDFVVLTSAQMIEVRKQVPEDFQQRDLRRGADRRRHRRGAQLRAGPDLGRDDVGIPRQDRLHEGMSLPLSMISKCEAVSQDSALDAGRISNASGRGLSRCVSARLTAVSRASGS